MTKQDLVSVIIPAYNSEEFVGKAIESAVNQTYNLIEVLVIEDGSTDSTLEEVKRWSSHPKVSIHTHEEGINMGVSKTRKLGLERAQGEYIAFLDADDIFISNKIQKQVEILKSNPDVGLIHSKVSLINETSHRYYNEFGFDIKDQPYEYRKSDNWLKTNHICNSTVLAKANMLKDLDFAFPQVFQFEDWLTWSLMSLNTKFFFIDEPLASYRLHEASATANILKNSLVSHYSKIEYLLTFYLALPDEHDFLSKGLLVDLKRTLLKLLENYGGTSRLAALASQINVESIDDCEKELMKLSQSYESLKEEHDKIIKVKNSFAYRVLNKFVK